MVVEKCSYHIGNLHCNYYSHMLYSSHLNTLSRPIMSFSLRDSLKMTLQTLSMALEEHPFTIFYMTIEGFMKELDASDIAHNWQISR